MKRISVIDSHTAGEPTRVIVRGGPDLGTGTLPEKLEIFRKQFDSYRTAVVGEPRGSDVLVGALLTEPSDSSCAAGVIFFNNVGYLGMCGHGMIGLVRTLAHLGRIQSGNFRIETPVGVVGVRLSEEGNVSVENVPSYRRFKDLAVNVDALGAIVGDVAWGGNWFFLTENHGQSLVFENVEHLSEVAWKIRCAVNAAGYPEVDHVELMGPPATLGADARNFVLCPGRAYDRSPCGTGTSAKLACLAVDGKLGEGQVWVQESIIGSRFQGSFQRRGEAIVPTITGRAFIMSEAELLLDSTDSYCWGICSERAGV